MITLSLLLALQNKLTFIDVPLDKENIPKKFFLGIYIAHHGKGTFFKNGILYSFNTE